MKLSLQSLLIQNFAGIKEESFIFDGKDAKIFGDNATGKTTTAVAINWLLFDKGLEGQKIDIVPKDDSNNHIHEAVPIVSAIFEMDGIEIKLSRESHPNYEKVEGSTKKHYKNSRTTKQYIDEVPHPITKYKSEINKIIDEDVFKLVTNPDAFPQLHWQDKRKTLFEISGDITDEQVIESSEELNSLLDVINNRSIEDEKKVLKEKLSKAKEDLEYIPVQIRTLNDQLDDDIYKYNVLAIEKELETHNESLTVLNTKRMEIENGGAALEIRKQINEKQFELDNMKRSIESDSTDKKNGVERELSSLKSDLEIFESKADRISSEIKVLNGRKDSLLSEYHELVKERDTAEMERFHAHVDDTCPTCSQTLPESDIESARKTAEEQFNMKKSQRLEQLQTNIDQTIKAGKDIAAAVEKNKERRNDIDTQELTTNKRIQTLEQQIEKLNGAVVSAEDNKAYQELRDEIQALEEKLSNDKSNVQTQVAEINEQIVNVQSEISECQNLIAQHKATENIKKSIEEYHAKEDSLLDIIEELKHQQYLLDQFTKTKVNLITEKVNDMFDLARFKLFHAQVNGDIKETCEIMVDGVTYDGGLNNAMKINVGLDIIQTLSKHFNIEAPIFIDNSESVTQLKEVPAQQIQLVVSEADKVLRLN